MVRTLMNPIPIPTQSDNLYNSEGTVMESGISTSFNLLHAKTINLYTNGRRISTRSMSRIRTTDKDIISGFSTLEDSQQGDKDVATL